MKKIYLKTSFGNLTFKTYNISQIGQQIKKGRFRCQNHKFCEFFPILFKEMFFIASNLVSHPKESVKLNKKNYKLFQYWRVKTRHCLQILKWESLKNWAGLNLFHKIEKFFNPEKFLTIFVEKLIQVWRHQNFILSYRLQLRMRPLRWWRLNSWRSSLTLRTRTWSSTRTRSSSTCVSP